MASLSMAQARSAPASLAARFSRGILRIGLNGALIFVALLCLFPFFLMLSGSLQTIEELYAGITLWPPVPQFQNYVTAWTEGTMDVFIPNSILYSVVVSAGVLFASSMAGYALARINFIGRNAVMFMILAIMIVPLPASFIALYKLLVGMGLANTRMGYMLPLIAGGLPVSIFILQGFFVRQPQELEDAAVLDGCSAFDVFWRVMLPLAKPGLAAVVVIEFLQVWNEYLLALVVFNSQALMPIQTGLMQFVASDTPMQHILLAATVIAALPVLLLYAFAQKSIVQGLMEGAVKG